MDSLAAEYLKSKRNYASSKKTKISARQSNFSREKEARENDHLDCLEESNVTTWSGSPSPPLMPIANEIKTSCNAQEEKFIQQIRVVGIRATREKVLIESFTNATASYRERINDLSSSLEQWVAYSKLLEDGSANALRELELELVDEIGGKRNVEDTVKQMKASHVEVQDELERLRNELKVVKCEKDELVKKNENEMNTFLDKMEVRVENVQSQMAKEIEEAKRTLNLENEQKFQDTIFMFHSERQQNENSLEAQRNRYNQELEQFERKLNEKDLAIKCSNDDKRRVENQLLKLQDEVKAVTAKHKVEMVYVQDQFRQMKEEREEELVQIEARVMHVLSAKDKQLQAALSKAAEAEEKTRTFECCIVKLENGFEELPSET